jgi:hypothetical protein
VCVSRLSQRLRDEQGAADLAHLRKLVRWSNGCLAFGLLTMGLAPRCSRTNL